MNATIAERKTAGSLISLTKSRSVWGWSAPGLVAILATPGKKRQQHEDQTRDPLYSARPQVHLVNDAECCARHDVHPRLIHVRVKEHVTVDEQPMTE